MEDNKENILAELGKRIKKLREDKGLSIVKLADKADIGHATVEKLESGKMNPSYIILLKLAEALEVDLNTIAAIK